MNKEIEFKGKTEQGKWVYGYYYSYIREDNGQREHCILEDKPNLTMDFKINYVLPETVGQFTGLYDKSEDKQKIYEGDKFFVYGEYDNGLYIEDRSGYAYVDYDVEYGNYVIRELNGECIESLIDYLDSSYEYNEGKIIGNIYENKNLLERCKND